MHRPPELPFDGVVLGQLRDPLDVPRGCVVWSSGDGVEWVVYAPWMVEAMRHDCPECNGHAA